MRRETKFNYGFLCVGLAIPIIAEYFLGRACGVIVAILVAAAGGIFLVFGHAHREAGEIPLSGRTKMATYGMVGALIALATFGIRYVYRREVTSFRPSATAQSVPVPEVKTADVPHNTIQTPLVPRVQKKEATKTQPSSSSTASDNSIHLEAGKGGDATSNSNGGTGGSINITAGSGGNAGDMGNGGAGGNIIISAGAPNSASIPANDSPQLKLPMDRQLSDFEAAIRALAEQFPGRHYSTHNLFNRSGDGVLQSPSPYDIPVVMKALEAKGEIKITGKADDAILFDVTPRQ